MPAFPIPVLVLLPLSKTNLIALWPERETESLRLEGRILARSVTWGKSESAGSSSSEARKRGERRHSQVPSVEHNLRVPAVLPHHTDTCRRFVANFQRSRRSLFEHLHFLPILYGFAKKRRRRSAVNPISMHTLVKEVQKCNKSGIH